MYISSINSMVIETKVLNVIPKILPEELAVKSALPALRANIAKELMIKYGMIQNKI